MSSFLLRSFLVVRTLISFGCEDEAHTFTPVRDDCHRLEKLLLTQRRLKVSLAITLPDYLVVNRHDDFKAHLLGFDHTVEQEVTSDSLDDVLADQSAVQPLHVETFFVPTLVAYALTDRTPIGLFFSDDRTEVVEVSSTRQLYS